MVGADGLPKLKPPATKNLIPLEYQRLYLHGTPANTPVGNGYLELVCR